MPKFIIGDLEITGSDLQIKKIETNTFGKIQSFELEQRDTAQIGDRVMIDSEQGVVIGLMKGIVEITTLNGVIELPINDVWFVKTKLNG